MKKKSLTLSMISVMVALAVSGCGPAYEMVRQHNNQTEMAVTAARDKQFKATQLSAAPVVRQDAPIMVVNRPVSAKNRLPSKFYDHIEINKAKPVDIKQAVDVLAYEYPDFPMIRLANDALNTPKCMMANQSQLAVAAPAAGAGGNTQQQNTSLKAGQFYLSHKGTQKSLLDYIANRAGLSWSYSLTDDLVIFSRFQTRYLSLNVLGGKSAVTNSLQANGDAIKSGSGSSGSSGGSNKVEMEIKNDFWAMVKEQMNSIKTECGIFAINPTTNTVVYTDVPEAVERASELTKNEEGKMSRQINFRVDIYAVNENRGTELSVDWTKTLSNVARATASTLSLTGGTYTISPNAGSLSYNTLSSSSNANLVLSSLNENGKATLVNSFSVLALNNRTTPVNIVNQQEILDDTTVVAGTTTSGASSSIKKATINTGINLNLTPTVTQNDSVMLQMNLEISSLDALVDKTTTNGAATQLATTSRRQTMHSASLKNGDTTVLTGYQRMIANSNESGLLPTTILAGGSSNNKYTRENLIIMVTPTIVEGVK